MDSLNKNQVTFDYFIEDNEDNKKEGLPLYSIIIIILIGMAVIVASGFLIFKFGCRKKKYLIDDEISSSSSSNNNRKKFQEISLKDKSSSTRGISNKVKIIKFDDKQ